jgi:hypothetical protein
MRFIIAAVTYLSLFAGLFFGCAHVDSTRAGLVLIAEITTPAATAVYEACDALKEENPDSEHLRKCDAVADAMDDLAKLHEEAKQAYESGDLEEAQRLLSELRLLLRGGL